MISENMMKRLKKAAGYQRQAILALLPEGMEGHLDVIEKELKEMFAETFVNAMSGRGESGAGADKSKEGASGSVKKVTIE